MSVPTPRSTPSPKATHHRPLNESKASSGNGHGSNQNGRIDGRNKLHLIRFWKPALLFVSLAFVSFATLDMKKMVSPVTTSIALSTIAATATATITTNETLETIGKGTVCRNDSFRDDDDKNALNPCPKFDALEFDELRQREVDNGIQRIYYINLDKNVKRRNQMEFALARQHHLGWNKKPIPYQRIPAINGSEDSSICEHGLREPHRCNGLVGIIKSNLHTIRYHNVTGITLVMEDDFLLKNMSLIEEALQFVPNDWDIIRLDCIDERVRSSFRKIYHPDPKTTIFQANHGSRQPFQHEWDENWNFCGGTFAMLWRASSVSKLFKVWTELPARDLDCRLARDNTVRQYCFNTRNRLGEHSPPQEETTDIPKV